MDRRTLIRLAASAPIGLVGSRIAWGQDWPQRPIKFIVPFGPGSAGDIAARIFAEKLSPIWGQPVVVENRPGGDAIVAISAVVGANDNHMLLFCGSATFTPHPYVHEKLPYDEKRDLVPVAGVCEVSIGLAVPESLNVDSVADLMSLVRKEPGKLNWGAIASLDDFIFRGFLKSTGLTMSRVPYRDPISALNDLSQARIDVCLAALALVLPRVQTGKVKAIAVTNQERSSVAPNVPTVTEAGYPSLSYGPVQGIFGSRAMTPAISDRIASGLRTAAADPAVVSRLAPTGQVVRYVAPAEFIKAIEQERAKVAAIAKMVDIHPGD
ncbi:MAG: tripartite tricarboxylate transporter substrate binding protein [Xanthobacteraceae bacterium]|jgi:tripartite-type tricarboxylate transporter receptor subunit TctC